MSKLVNELTAEIQSSNPNLTPEEVYAQIVILMEDEILPSVIARLRLPKLPSPIEVQIEKFRKTRRRGQRDGDGLEKKISFIQELEKIRHDHYASDFTYVGFQVDDPKDFNRIPLPYPADHWTRRKKRVPIETDEIPPKLETESFLDVGERKAQKLSDLITFDESISKKIVSDPHFETTLASLESKIREKFRDIPNISFVFSIRQDVNDPAKGKTVIHVKIPNSSFKDKMNNWLRIDFEVRKTIKELGLAEAEKKAINRNFVTHVEST